MLQATETNTMEKKYQGLGYDYYDSLSDRELIKTQEELKSLWESGTRLRTPYNLAMAAAFRRGERKSKDISFDIAISYLLRDSIESVKMFRDQPVEDVALLLKMFKGEPLLFDNLGYRVGEVKYTKSGCEISICGIAGTLYLSYVDIAKKCLTELRK